MILENGYEVPEGMESMTCINNCGFIILWSVGSSDGVGERMDDHAEYCPVLKKQKRFRTKGE